MKVVEPGLSGNCLEFQFFALHLCPDIGLPNRTKNDDRGGGVDLHQSGFTSTAET